jgi:hypothetical protein
LLRAKAWHRGGGEGSGLVAWRDHAFACYDAGMTRDEVKAVLDRVLTWPPEQQKVAVEVLQAIEEQTADADQYQLTDEQVAEVRRRRAKENPKHYSLAEMRARFDP